MLAPGVDLCYSLDVLQMQMQILLGLMSTKYNLNDCGKGKEK